MPDRSRWIVRRSRLSKQAHSARTAPSLAPASAIPMCRRVNVYRETPCRRFFSISKHSSKVIKRSRSARSVRARRFEGSGLPRGREDPSNRWCNRYPDQATGEYQAGESDHPSAHAVRFDAVAMRARLEVLRTLSRRACGSARWTSRALGRHFLPTFTTGFQRHG